MTRPRTFISALLAGFLALLLASSASALCPAPKDIKHQAQGVWIGPKGWHGVGPAKSGQIDQFTHARWLSVHPKKWEGIVACYYRVKGGDANEVRLDNFSVHPLPRAGQWSNANVDSKHPVFHCQGHTLRDCPFQ